MKKTCQYCGSKRAVTTKGLIRKHGHGIDNIGSDGNYCSGSGQLPLEKDALIALDKLVALSRRGGNVNEKAILTLKNRINWVVGD